MRAICWRASPKAPLDNAAFPFGAIREIGIASATVLASRRTYVGELGWELYVPAEHAGGVYDALMEAGADFGVRNCGYYAIESLRLEKGYRAWGRELTPDYNPYEAGLGFAVKLDKGDFIGRDALLAAKGKPPARRLLSFVAHLARHADRAWRRADPAQRRAGGRGHVGGLRPHASAASSRSAMWRPAARASMTRGLSARFEIDIAGERVPVRASLKAPYDPAGVKMKT